MRTMHTAERRLVDVLLPVHNGAATIAQSIASLQRQTVGSLRIIVIDDGSTDATPEILAELARSDARITVIRKPNGGIVEALNVGLAQTAAAYVARQDADDISFPDRLQRQLDVLAGDAAIVAVSGACKHIDADGRELGTTYVPGAPTEADYDALPSTEPYLLHPFLMVRREAFLAAGGYRYVLHAEDTDLYWRLREAGRLHNMSEPLGLMRLHEGSISNASLQNGRIMAVHSQLAAISARRRAEGRADLAFSPDALGEYRSAPSLAAMVEIAGRALTTEEQRYLRGAACAKLLELAIGRLYDIDAGDCRYVREAYAALDPRVLGTRSVANWAYRTSLRQLLRRGRFPELLALLDFKILGYAIALRLRALAAREPVPQTARVLPYPGRT